MREWKVDRDPSYGIWHIEMGPVEIFWTPTSWLYHSTFHWKTTGFYTTHRTRYDVNDVYHRFPYIEDNYQIPLWFAAIVFGLVPARYALRLQRMRKRARSGRCPSCGYDIHATPEICPECGRDFFGRSRALGQSN
jgi:predicted RNA-binding Zn-ribbon protein involved in translation (DUF1610 family)